MAEKINLEVDVKSALNIIGALFDAQISRGVVNTELSALSQDLTVQLLSQSTEEEIKSHAVIKQ